MKIILTIVTLFILISCGKEKSKDMFKVDREEIENTRRMQNLKEIEKKYGATITLDTADYWLTYQYQQLLKANNLAVIDGFRISDIEERDSNFVVSIRKSSKLFLELSCTKEQLDILYPDLSVKPSYSKDIFIIAKIDDVNKIKIKIDSYGEDKGDSETETYVELRVSNAFFSRGTLIDIQINRNP